jgi:hypothetical protein
MPKTKYFSITIVACGISYALGFWSNFKHEPKSIQDETPLLIDFKSKEEA